VTKLGIYSELKTGILNYGCPYEKKKKNLYKMQSKIAILSNYALYEITHMQYMYVIYLFYYALIFIWLFYIKINMHKKKCKHTYFFYMHIIFTFF
jgi:hypothetical protein